MNKAELLNHLRGLVYTHQNAIEKINQEIKELEVKIDLDIESIIKAIRQENTDIIKLTQERNPLKPKFHIDEKKYHVCSEDIRIFKEWLQTQEHFGRLNLGTETINETI